MAWAQSRPEVPGRAPALPEWLFEAPGQLWLKYKMNVQSRNSIEEITIINANEGYASADGTRCRSLCWEHANARGALCHSGRMRQRMNSLTVSVLEPKRMQHGTWVIRVASRRVISGSEFNSPISGGINCRLVIIGYFPTSMMNHLFQAPFQEPLDLPGIYCDIRERRRLKPTVWISSLDAYDAV
jgi:hypothetical protein